MGRKRRDVAHASIVAADDTTEARAELIVDTNALGVPLGDLRRWFERVDGYPVRSPRESGNGASIVLDPFALVLYVGEHEISDAHEGIDFVDLAAADGVTVLVGEVDARRAKPSDLAAAAHAGQLLAARVPAYPVDTL